MMKVGFSAADIAAAMYALSSILAALYRRNVTGEGAAISLSMLECLAEWTAPAVYAAAHAGVVPERSGHRHAMIAPYGLYRVGGGRSVLVAVQSNPEWASFATVVLGDPTLVDDPRFADNEDRIANVGALETQIAAVFDEIDIAEAQRRLTSGRIAWAHVHDPMQVWDHDQLAARDRKMEVTHAGGRATMFRPPFNISDSPDPSPRVPALGEHDRSLVDRIVGGDDQRRPHPAPVTAAPSRIGGRMCT